MSAVIHTQSIPSSAYVDKSSSNLEHVPSRCQDLQGGSAKMPRSAREIGTKQLQEHRAIFYLLHLVAPFVIFTLSHTAAHRNRTQASRQFHISVDGHSREALRSAFHSVLLRPQIGCEFSNQREAVSKEATELQKKCVWSQPPNRLLVLACAY